MTDADLLLVAVIVVLVVGALVLWALGSFLK